jgi:hypothetical protein
VYPIVTHEIDAPAIFREEFDHNIDELKHGERGM